MSHPLPDDWHGHPKDGIDDADFIPWEKRVVVHECPEDSDGLMPCCGRSPAERPGDRIAMDPRFVTCVGTGWRLPLPDGWLGSTKRFQEQVFDVDMDDPDVEYVRWNALAVVNETMEMLDEFQWKPWSSRAFEYDRTRVVEEAVDILHFIANILAAIGVSDEELWEAYRAKQEENARRQRDGY